MKVQEAIEKAIEVGYTPPDLNHYRLVIEPLFWKAFFESMKGKLGGEGCCAECYYNLFHKHIWRGGTIDSFFEKL